MMSGQITAPFFLDKYPFIKINNLGLGGAATIQTVPTPIGPVPVPVPTQLSMALSLTILNTTATGAMALDVTTGVRAYVWTATRLHFV